MDAAAAAPAMPCGGAVKPTYAAAVPRQERRHQEVRDEFRQDGEERQPHDRPVRVELGAVA